MDLKGAGFDRVYIITTNNQVLGQMSYVRLPRKEKKRRKKAGTFEPPKFVGFDLSKLSNPS